jgi:nitrite reductase/ring-hydroxylating ferredoxin subunit
MTSRSVTGLKVGDIKPGELRRYDLDGVPIAIANVNGRFFAVDDTCSHEQCSLAEEGTLEGTVITCACHGAQFDTATGAVLAPPAVEPLRAYQVGVDGNDLVVEL